MKDVLVHARGFAQPTAACRFGAQLAARFGASMTMVYVYASPLYLGPAYDAAVIDALLQESRAHVLQAREAGDALVRWAIEAGVPQSEWLIAEGLRVDALVLASTRHDLLVLDHPENADVAAWDMPGLILKSASPCIVLPRQPAEYEPEGRAVLAWNGSPEAMRAIHSALPLLQGRQVLLLRGEERGRDPSLEWHPPFDIESYLARRGVTITVRPLEAKPDEVGTALLDESAAFGASLLVMGAYGRTRFSEWLLGGATRDALTWARIPVLLQH